MLMSHTRFLRADRLDDRHAPVFHSRPPLQRRIQPTRGLRRLDLRELWSYRELLYFLTWRDIKVRYKQTAIGIAWAVPSYGIIRKLPTLLVEKTRF